ncbi:MAG: metallophosphoesterase [Deltaproteobacteria bacterium]|nr:metallophosphoesterase [Deltaproteobacteria bacterium]
MISRRAFFKSGVLLGGALMLEGFVIEPRKIKVEEVPVKIKGLAPEFNNFTICQITDIHHSPIVGLEYIDNVVKTANNLKPDLTVLTGDYIDEEKKYMEPVIKSLSSLKAKHGIISILGNHDHFIGKEYAAKVIESHNIPLLENAHRLIEKGGSALCIAGVKDFWEDSPDIALALKGVDREIPRVVLSHHPDYSEFVSKQERVDLVLSGHTHGGQVRLPFGYAPIVPSSYGQKYSGGLVQNGESQTYVSRGVGVVMIPVRINCPPELTLIRLIAA